MDAGSKRHQTPDPEQNNYAYLTYKIVKRLSQILLGGTGILSQIRIFFHPGSWIQGSKNHCIQDPGPDPQHDVNYLLLKSWRYSPFPRGLKKRCRLSWLTNIALFLNIRIQMRGDAGLPGLSQWVKLCRSRDIRAQINFGDLTPYWTYVFSSVADPWHFGVDLDPDPRINASE
jgi:hypothetical protein